jgi:hypothetical protein
MSTGLCLGAALSNFKLETVCIVHTICQIFRYLLGASEDIFYWER